LNSLEIQYQFSKFNEKRIGFFMPLTGQSSGQLVISVKEARKLLGQKSKNLTNEELETLIKDTETVVRIFVRNYIGSKKDQNSVTIPNNKVITI